MTNAERQRRKYDKKRKKPRKEAAQAGEDGTTATAERGKSLKIAAMDDGEYFETTLSTEAQPGDGTAIGNCFQAAIASQRRGSLRMPGIEEWKYIESFLLSVGPTSHAKREDNTGDAEVRNLIAETFGWVDIVAPESRPVLLDNMLTRTRAVLANPHLRDYWPLYAETPDPRYDDVIKGLRKTLQNICSYREILEEKIKSVQRVAYEEAGFPSSLSFESRYISRCEKLDEAAKPIQALIEEYDGTRWKWRPLEWDEIALMLASQAVRAWGTVCDPPKSLNHDGAICIFVSRALSLIGIRKFPSAVSAVLRGRRGTSRSAFDAAPLATAAKNVQI